MVYSRPPLLLLVDRLLGTRQVFELEEQLLHFHALVGLNVCLIASGFDLYLQLPMASLLVTIALGILFISLYVASRCYRLAQPAALIHWGLTTAMVPLLWVVNGGVRGALPLLSLVYVQYFSTVVKVRWVAIAFHFWVVGSCLSIEVWHPEWIVPYPNPWAQMADTYFAFAISGMILYVNCRFVVQAYAQERQQAQGALMAKNQFLSTFSHEFRTPMNGIIGTLDLLLQDPQLPALYRDSLSTIQSSATLLGSMLQDVVDYTQIESGLLKLELSIFELSGVLLPLIKMGEEATKEKGLTFITDIQPDLPVLIQGDRLRLQQVLLHLLTNGIKFTERGTVCFSVTGQCTTASQWQLTFTITDTGIGMTPELQTQIFQPFTLGDASNTRSYSGAGMGLALAKQWVNLMGGAWGVASQPGEGSKVQVHVPVTAIAQQPQTTPTTSEGASFSFRTLVVDDAATNQKILQRFLERLGCTVRLANNGLEAIAQAEQHAFDFVFMDLQMPEMDGIEATKIIRQRTNESVQPIIIAITANALDEARNQCLAAGMNDFATKPITSGKVCELLKLWGTPSGPSDGRC